MLASKNEGVMFKCQDFERESYLSLSYIVRSTLVVLILAKVSGYNSIRLNQSYSDPFQKFFPNKSEKRF